MSEVDNNTLYEMLKNGQIYFYQIKDPTDEMKWWAIENNCMLGSADLTKEMVCALIRKAKKEFKTSLIDGYSIPEDAWIEGIRNAKDVDMMRPGFLSLVLEKAEMTEKIATEMCLKIPYYYNTLGEHVPEYQKQLVSNSFFSKLEKGYDWHFELPKGLPMSQDQWEWMVREKYFLKNSLAISDYIGRDDTPEFVRRSILKEDTILRGWGEMSAEDLVFWLNIHRGHIEDYLCQVNIRNYIKCSNMEQVMKECGWFIKYWKNQSERLCKAAIECDPYNIQYINKPSDKLCLYAMSLDRSVATVLPETEAVCKALGKTYQETSPYPAEYYLVRLREDLCDEGELVKVCVVEGRNMESFLNRKTQLSFGNMHDSEKREVASIAWYQPISREELAVLRKFGLDDLEAGYFSNLDYENGEEHDEMERE